LCLKGEAKAEEKEKEEKDATESPSKPIADGSAGLNRRQRRALARGEAPVKGKLSAAAMRKAKQADRAKEKKVERKESAANAEVKAEAKAEAKAEVKATAKAGKNGKGKAMKGRASLPSGGGEGRPAKRPRKSVP